MTIDLPRARRLIAAAAVAGLVLRLAFALGYWVDKPLTHDEREYLALAHSLAAGRGFSYGEAVDTGTAQQFGRAPAYPLFLAAIGAGRADYSTSPTRVKLAQGIVGAFGVWLIGMIALRAAGTAAGAWAAAIAAIYPPLVWMCTYVLSEALYSTLALAAVLLLDMSIDRSRAEGRGGGSLALTAGLVTGVAILTRPVMLFFLPLAAVWLILGRRAVLAFALVAAAIVVLAPWTARNVRAYHRFVLVASEGGVTFWTGNHPLARGEGDLAANPELKRADLAFRRAHPDLTPEQLEPLYYRDALRYIATHPGTWLGLVARKAVYTVLPIGPSYALHSSKYRLTSVASYLLLLAPALPGFVRLAKGRRPPAALFLLAASAVLVSLVFFPQERFRIPVLDPTLVVCAGATCASRLKNQ